MSATPPIITIDGPAGSGKGTIASMVAKKLAWHLLDSGAIYRIAAYAALQKSVDLSDELGLVQLIQGLNMEFSGEQVLCDGEDVSLAIRTPECAEATSKISALPAVRAALLDRQRSFHKLPGLVADGRDMGTVVFPDASVKIFLTASPSVRAERRYNQLRQQGISANIDQLEREINIRDERDSNRPVAPLKPATDAWVIDSSYLSPNDVLEKILHRLR